MQIVKSDLYQLIYRENIDEITRQSDDLITLNINIGCGEVQSYLNRYDVDVMFGAAWENDFFKNICVTVIAWKLIQLCGPNIDREVVRVNYEDVIKFLEKVQKGLVRPDWPLRPEDPGTIIDDSGNIQWNSNPKRRFHY